MAERSLQADVDPLPPRSELQRTTDDAREIRSETYTSPQQPTSANLTATQQPTSTASQNDHPAVDTRKDLPSTPLPPYYHFNILLLEISEKISSDTLEKIKFVYKDEIKSGLNKKIENARELFRILEQRRYIVPESMINLQGIVMMIEEEDTRKELMTRIFQHSVEHKAVYFRRSTDEPPNGYRPVQCHIKGVEHFKFNTDRVRDLQHTVASITGIALSEILVDRIQITNSIYITFLVKDVHYRLFYELLGNGIPLLSELNVDMVTFYNVEEKEQETNVDVLSGRRIYLQLPPVQESPEETIHRLHCIIEEIQIQNLNYRRKNEELSAQIRKLSAKVDSDLKALSENVQKTILDALQEDVSKPYINRVIESNAQLEESLEETQSATTINKTRSEIECKEVEQAHREYLKNQQERNSADKEKLPTGDNEGIAQSGSDEDYQRTLDGEVALDTSNDNEEQVLLENLNDVLKRADGLGYSKSVIEQIVVRNRLYVEHKCKKTYQIEMKWLTWNDRLLQDRLSVTESLLQRTANTFGFKQGLLSQIEAVFESKGNNIPGNKGYKIDVIELVMELSSMITYEEEQKLICGFDDVPLSKKVKRDRRFLLLRLYYVENLKSDLLILIEVFVSKKLRFIEREDLEKRWSLRVVPRYPAKDIQELLQHMVQENIPGLPDLFVHISSRLSEHDKTLLRRKLPKDDKSQDQELLQRLVELNNKNRGQPDDLLPFVKAIMEDINRKGLYEEFEVKYLRLVKGLNPEVREILQSVCSKLSNTKRKELKTKLKNSKYVEDNDILECLIIERFENQAIILIDELDAFVNQALREINKQELYDEFKAQLKERGLKGLPYPNLQFKFQPAGNETYRLILEKLKELGEEMKSIKANQAGSQTGTGTVNTALGPWGKGLASEREYLKFFQNTVRARGFDIGNQPFQFN